MTLLSMTRTGVGGLPDAQPASVEVPIGTRELSRLFSRVLGSNPSSIASILHSGDLRGFSPEDTRRLTQLWGRGGLRSLGSLAQERDAGLYYSDLASLARDLNQEGHREGAELIFHHLQEALQDNPDPSLRGLAAEATLALQVLHGEGPLGAQLEDYSHRFLDEALSPATLGGMALGQLAFAPLRHGVLRMLWNPGTGRFALGSLGSRFVASGVGLAGEVPVFWGASKGIQSYLTPGEVSWDAAGNLRELGALAMTLGILRLTGFGSQSALRWARGSSTTTGMGLRVTERMLPATSAISGLFLAHSAEEAMGWRNSSTAWSRLLDSTVVYFQFGITGRVAQGLLGPRFHFWNQEMETRLQQRLETPRRPGGMGSVGWTWQGTPALAGSVPEGFLAMAESREGSRPVFAMMMDGEGGGRTLLARIEPLLREVLERGRSDELLVLKDILLEVYRETHQGEPSERMLRHLQSQDPEEWKLAISVMATGDRTSPGRLRQGLEADAAFQEFSARWRSRPHYLKASEVPVQLDSALKLNAAQKKVVGEFQTQLFREANLKGMTEFLQWSRLRHKQAVEKGRPSEYQVQRIQSGDGRTHFAGNVGELGIHAIFNGEGIFQSPVRFQQVFEASRLETIWESLRREGLFPEHSLEQVAAPKLTGEDIAVSYAEGTRRGYAFDQTVRRFRELLAQAPTLDGVRGIYQAHTAKHDVLETFAHESGAITAVINRGRIGVVVNFDPAGRLLLPLEISGKFTPDALQARLGELRRGGPPGHAEPIPEPTGSEPETSPNPFLPQDREKPIDYTFRLMEASRHSEDHVQLQLVQALEQLLAQQDTREFGVEILRRIGSLTEGLPAHEQAVVRTYELPGLETPLEIFSPITTFLPEDWSLFFAEKVSRYIEEHGGHRDRVAELGSGTGWLSIYLRARGLATYMEGGDRTDTAPVVSRINAQLNGVDSVRFVQSDLWKGMSQDAPFDLVVACIPQIPQVAEMISQRGFADYAPHRDNVMRPFGLGLIHDALTESLPRLNGNGRILLNLAGRPGLATLLEMYRRTGYHPIVRDSEIIGQDAETDISPLAALEAHFPGVRFEFLPPEGSGLSPVLSARDAVELRDSQGVAGIRHRQFLIEGAPYGGIWNQVMTQGRALPARYRWAYTPDAGTEFTPLREALARHLSRDWGMELDPGLLFVAPEAEFIAEGFLRLRVPANTSMAWVGEVPEGFERLKNSMRGFQHRKEVWDPEALRESLAAGEIQGAVVFPPALAWNDGETLNSLMESFAARGKPLVLVEPYGVRAASREEGPMTRLASDPQLAANTLLVQDLQRRWQGRIPLGVGMVADPQVYRALSHWGELTYSRTSTAAQQLYLEFLQHLDTMDSHLVDPLLNPSGTWRPLSQSPLGIWDSSNAFARALAHPGAFGSALAHPGAFGSAPQGTRSRPIIDMSFGESEWQAPVDLAAAWDWAKVQGAAYDEIYRDTRIAVEGYLRDTRHMEVDRDQIVLGYGVHPLIHTALRTLGGPGRPALNVFVPQGSYGLFYPTVESAGGRVQTLKTLSAQEFLVNPHLLEQALRAPQLVPTSRPVLLLNVPTNPAGRYYSPEQLRNLAELMQRHRGVLLFDDVFGLLNHQQIPIRPQAYASEVWEAMGEAGIYFGGISKEFAAGGLRLGWAASRNPHWARAMERSARPRPDLLALSAAPRYLQNWRTLLPQHQNYLVANRRLLTELLDERHIEYHQPEGGYSLLVDFNSFFNQGRILRRGDGTRVTLTPQNFSQMLFEEAGIKINSDEWSQTPGQYRFVFAIDNMETAVDRLRRFLRSTR